MKTQFLVEQLTANEGNIVTEAIKEGNEVYLKGIIMQAGIKNRNGREYPLHEMVAAVNAATQQIKEHGGIFGELDHPQTISINMDRISHVITEMKMDGNNVFGVIRLLNTPMGQIAKELARSGVRYGVSSRATGNVNESGVVSSFQFCTVDLVVTPSAPGAMPTAVFEALEASKTGRSILTLSESLQQDKDAQKYFKEQILSFVKELNRKA
jgi:hypothetical protein